MLGFVLRMQIRIRIQNADFNPALNSKKGQFKGQKFFIVILFLMRKKTY